MRASEDTTRTTSGAFALETLRRSSLRLTPTRTLRISEAELNPRDSLPTLATVEDLSNRPRSNPRTRTPRRYESPLDPAEFRRHSVEHEPVTLPRRTEPARITIRPLTGTAVGTVINATRGTEQQRTDREPVRSRKQGPSHRKVRRWNNDHFSGLVSEIASSSSRGREVAELLLKAQCESKFFRSIYDPTEAKSESLTSFMSDPTLRDLRDRFFEGELPSLPNWNSKSTAIPEKSRSRALTVQDRLNRVDARLRRVVVKAVNNSCPAARVVQRFEDFVLGTFSPTDSSPKEDEDWKGLLLEPPTVVSERGVVPSIAIRFHFDPDSSTGGFHRLLLHAVCQFHGLDVESRMVHLPTNSSKALARELVACGFIPCAYTDRLLLACDGSLTRKDPNVAESVQSDVAVAVADDGNVCAEK